MERKLGAVHEISIDEFLETWWFESFLRSENNNNRAINDVELAWVSNYVPHSLQQQANLAAKIEEIKKNLNEGNVLPVKVFLFLNWLIEDISVWSLKTKVPIQFCLFNICFFSIYLFAGSYTSQFLQLSYVVC